MYSSLLVIEIHIHVLVLKADLLSHMSDDTLTHTNSVIKKKCFCQYCHINF